MDTVLTHFFGINYNFKMPSVATANKTHFLDV